MVLACFRQFPGQRFSLDLVCDDLFNVAGFDIGIEFPPDLLDISSVRKTPLTGDFLLLKQLTPVSLSVSVAGVQGIQQRSGALLTLGGVVSSTVSESVAVSLVFTKAKLYDVDSLALPLVTRDGTVFISTGDDDDSLTPSTPPSDSNEGSLTPTGIAGDDELTPTIPEGDEATETPTEYYSEGPPGGPIEDPTSPDIWDLPEQTETPTSPSANPTADHTSEGPLLSPTPTQTEGTFAPPVLKTDMDHNGRVDSRDLFLFVIEWGNAQ